MAPFFELPAGRRPRHGAGAPCRDLPSRLARFAAVDLGAESGPRRRSAASTGARCRSRSSTASPTARSRFPTACAGICSGCSPTSLDGLALAAARAPLAGVGVDAWGVDYALLDGSRAAARPARSTIATGARAGWSSASTRVVSPRRALRRDRHPDDADQHDLPAAWPTPAARRSRARERIALRAGPLRAVAQRRARERDHRRLDDRAARRPQRRLGARDRRPPGPAGGARSPAGSSSPARALGAVLAAHADRAGGACGAPVCDGRRPRHRVRVRRGAAAPAAGAGGALVGHLVAARRRGRRAVPRRRRGGREPHQRARPRRHDAAAAQRHGPVAARGVPPLVGSAPASPCDYAELLAAAGRGARRTSRCSIPTTRR